MTDVAGVDGAVRMTDVAGVDRTGAAVTSWVRFSVEVDTSVSLPLSEGKYLTPWPPGSLLASWPALGPRPAQGGMKTPCPPRWWCLPYGVFLMVPDGVFLWSYLGSTGSVWGGPGSARCTAAG